MKMQEACRIPNRLDKKKSPRHITIKTINILNKEKNIKNCKGKGQVTNKGRPIRIIPDLSMETKKDRRFWSRDMQTLRDHECQNRLLYPAQLSVTID